MMSNRQHSVSSYHTIRFGAEEGLELWMSLEHCTAPNVSNVRPSRHQITENAVPHSNDINGGIGLAA